MSGVYKLRREGQWRLAASVRIRFRTESFQLRYSGVSVQKAFDGLSRGPTVTGIALFPATLAYNLILYVTMTCAHVCDQWTWPWVYLNKIRYTTPSEPIWTSQAEAPPRSASLCSWTVTRASWWTSSASSSWSPTTWACRSEYEEAGGGIGQYGEDN